MVKGGVNNQKRKFKIFLFVLFLGTLFYFGFIYENVPSGRVVSDLDVDYEEGQSLQGTLKFLLKEGELMPANSKIIIENAGQTYEYFLSELVLDEMVEGNFYVEGKSVAGSGEGYGVKGTKKVYPPVSFDLNIYSKASSEGPTQLPTSPAQSPSIPSEITRPPEGGAVIEEEIATEVVEETGEEVAEPIITGEIIGNLFKGVSNFFLGLTGQVSVEFENQVSGDVSVDAPFVYELSEGQTAELVSSSQDVNLNVEGNQVTITTDYFENEEGFGEDYLGVVGKEIVVDLSELNLEISEGELGINLIYEDIGIVSVSEAISAESSTLLSEEETTEVSPLHPSEDTQNETQENATLINETEVVENVTAVGTALSLSENERNVLVNNFGNVSLRTTRAEVVDGRLVVRYEIGGYWVEYSYDYSGEINDELEVLMQEDRTDWLRDLVNKLSEGESSFQGVSELVKNYEI